MRLLFFAPLLALPLAAPAARASEKYPQKIQAELGLAAAPPCTICHKNDEGGAHTVVRDFGLSMMRLGLKGGENGALLVAALRASRDQALDVDGDGVIDVDELVAGTDPNVPESGGEGGVSCTTSSPPELRTGCTVGHFGDARGARGAAAALALLAFVSRRRRA